MPVRTKGDHSCSILLALLWLVCSPSVGYTQLELDPLIAEFDPSADHSAVFAPGGEPVVERYELELYQAGAETPFDTWNLGKPTPEADGRIRVDLPSSLPAWPPAAVSYGTTYEGRLVAVGPRGVGRSGPTNPFVFSADPPFTDELMSAGVLVKAVHFIELRDRINAVRVGCGAPPFSWADPVLVPGSARPHASHLAELRSALEGGYAACGLGSPTYTDPVLTPGVTVIRAVHIVELRLAVVALD
jgi:hypothetical protein